MNQNSNTPLTDQHQDETVNFGYRTVSAADKVKLVQSNFDAIAPHYDRMNTFLSFGLHYLWKRTAISMLKLEAGEQVIDVCGGTADLAIMAARAVGPSGSVTVYDINHAMMAVGRVKARKTSLENQIHFVQGDAERISLPDNLFDAAVVGFGIRNVTHMEQGLAEMYRVLKPEGTFLCLEFSQPTSALFRRLYDFYSFYIMPRVGRLFTGSSQAYRYLPESIRLFPSPPALSALLEQNGFAHVSYRTLTNGIAAIHTATKG